MPSETEGEEVKNSEGLFSRIDTSLTDILNELKKNKLDSISEESSVIKNPYYLKDITKRIYQRLDTIENDMSVLQGILMALEQNNLDTEKSVSDLRELKINFDKRVKFNENIIDSLQREVIKIKDMKNIKNQPDNDAEAIKKIDYIQGELEPKTTELNNRLSRLEEKVKAINSSVTSDSQLSEIINRLVFLESRIVAMESMIRKLPHSPIVVE